MLKNQSYPTYGFRNNPYLFSIGTNLLFIVSIAIHPSKVRLENFPSLQQIQNLLPLYLQTSQSAKLLMMQRYVQSSKV